MTANTRLGRTASAHATDMARAGMAAHVLPGGRDAGARLERAGVMIVPLQIGGGTRLKIVEALALDTPVVSTTIGAEGLGLIDRRHLLLADTTDAFVAATAELLHDRPLAEHLGRTGGELVNRRFRWSVLAEELVDYWERVAFSGALTPSR